MTCVIALIVGTARSLQGPPVPSPTVSEATPDERETTAPPAVPTRVLLVRHAVTAETGPKLTGRAPGVDLSDVGREQARAVADRLAPLPVKAVYASPMERTTQTAEHVAVCHDLAVVALAAAIEADYGDWTGGLIADLSKTPEWKVVQSTPSRAQFPGGETIRSMQARMVGGIEDVVRNHPGDTVVLVSHADPIKAAIAHFAGMHLDLFQRLHVSPASVTALEFHPHAAMVLKVNDTGSLDELRAPVPNGESRKQ